MFDILPNWQNRLCLYEEKEEIKSFKVCFKCEQNLKFFIMTASMSPKIFGKFNDALFNKKKLLLAVIQRNMRNEIEPVSKQRTSKWQGK